MRMLQPRLRSGLLFQTSFGVYLSALRRAATSLAIRAASSGVRIFLIAGMILTIDSNVTGRSFFAKCLTR